MREQGWSGSGRHRRSVALFFRFFRSRTPYRGHFLELTRMRVATEGAVALFSYDLPLGCVSRNPKSRGLHLDALKERHSKQHLH